MPRVRRNEWNFAANAARLITNILTEDDYSSSRLGHAEPELTEFRGARRLDIVIFQRDNPIEPIITGETKVPWAADGRTPYNFSLIEVAHGKASRVGALYFITWNVRRVVVWKTDDPGVALIRRVVFDKELIVERLSSPSDLDSPRVQEALRNGVRELVAFLDSLLSGPPALSERGILYAPDYVANAGGVINVCIGALGWERARTDAKVEAIYDTLLVIFKLAEAEGIPTSLAADRLAERRLAIGSSGELKSSRMMNAVTS